MTRPDVTSQRVSDFLTALGRHATPGDRVYLAGGASAISEGWRPSTTDIDIRIEAAGDDMPLFQAIAQIKERLSVNVETAGPADFIPEPPGWRDSSRYIGRFGSLDAFHTDFTFQALAKLDRALPTDLADVDAMLLRRLTTPQQLEQTFADIKPQLVRFPNINPEAFEKTVHRVVETGFASELPSRGSRERDQGGPSYEIGD